MPQVGAAVAIQFGLFLAGKIIADVTAKTGKIKAAKTAYQLNTRSSREPIPILYGQFRMGVNKTFMHVTNPYLYMICELGEGPISGLVREDDSVYTTTGTQLPSDNPPLVYLDDKLWTEYGDSAYIEFFDGASDQSICTTLETATSKWDQTLRYTSYLMVRLKYDPDKFNSEPEVTAVIRGAEIYNPVDGFTEWTNNPALCAYDYITRSSQRGGIGISPSRIDITCLATTMYYCEQKGWTCNMPIGDNQAVSDNLELIFANFRGDIIQSANLLKIRFLDLNYESIVMSLGESDVIRSDEMFSSLEISQPDTGARPNAIRATHLSSEKKYKADDIVTSSATAIADEGDVREQAISVLGLSDPALVQKMSNYWLERLRLNKQVSFTGTSRCMALEPLDLVYFDHTMPGWTDKMLRVLSCPINGDHTVSLTFVEEASTLYDDVYNLTAHDWDDTNLPGPLDAVWAVTNVSREEEVYYYRNRSFTRWNIDFDAPAAVDYPWWDYAEIWLKIGSGEWRYMTRCDTNYSVDPVEEGETYYCKIRSVSIFGLKEDFDSCTTVSDTIVGATDAPGSLFSIVAIANGDSVTIYGTPLTGPDIEGYEIRLGATWASGIFISFNKNISLRLNGVRPGVHTFWAAAKNNSGFYSATPVSATVEVFVPPGYSELATYGSWSWDFSATTYSVNTEQVTYDGEDSLKCSHTADALNGYWMSPLYDLNSIVKVRIWGDFRIGFVSSATTWAGVYGANTWEGIDLGLTKSWSETFSPTTASQLTAVLYYKDAAEDDWDTITFFELLSAEVEARYIIVSIDITDPSLDSNLYLKELNMLAYEGPQ